jgi:hypothetical protein
VLRLRRLSARRAVIAAFAAATLLLTSCDISIAGGSPVQTEFHSPGHSELLAAPSWTSRILLQGQRPLLRLPAVRPSRIVVDPPRRIDRILFASSHLRLLPPVRRQHGPASCGSGDDPPA